MKELSEEDRLAIEARFRSAFDNSYKQDFTDKLAMGLLTTILLISMALVVIVGIKGLMYILLN